MNQEKAARRAEKNLTIHQDFKDLLNRYVTDTRFTMEERQVCLTKLTALGKIFDGIPVPKNVQAVLLFGSYSRSDKKPHNNSRGVHNSDFDICILTKKDFFLRRLGRRIERLFESSLLHTDWWWSPFILDRKTKLGLHPLDLEIHPYLAKHPLYDFQKDWIKTGTLIYGTLPKRFARIYGIWRDGGSPPDNNRLGHVQLSALI